MARIVVEIAGKDAGGTAVLEKANEAALAIGKSAENAGVSLTKFERDQRGILFKAVQNLDNYKKAASNALNTTQLNSYNLKIQDAEKEVQRLTNYGKTGFDQFGNAIKESGNAIIGVGSGLTKGLSALRTIAYVLPGVGIAGIFNLAFEAIIPLVNELDILNLKLTETQKNTRDLLNVQLGLIDVRQKGAQDAQKELVTADALYRATQNHNLSLTERKKAVNDIQEQYPKYLKNFSDEEILIGQAKKGYDALRNSIIALSYAKAAEDSISQKAAENIKLSYDFAVKQAAIERIRKEIADTPTQSKTDENAGIYALGVRNALEKQINDKLKEQDELRRRVQVNLSIINGLTKEIDKNVENNGVGILDKALDKTKIEKKVKITLEPNISNIGDLSASKLADIFPDTSELEKSVNDSIGHIAGKTAQETLKKNLAEMTEIASDYPRSITKILDDLNSAASNIINNEITSTFAGLGEAIGSSLAGTGNILENFTSVLLSGFGSLLEQLGKLAIETGVGVLAIKTALKTLNPFVAISAGIALVALGSSISKSVAQLGNVKGYAGGTNFAPGGVALVGERGPELVNLPRGAQVIPNHRIGSYSPASSNGFIAETSIGLESLWIGLRKQEKKLNLLGA